jgi:hypothetical protein
MEGKCAARLHWLHDCSIGTLDVDGYEFVTGQGFTIEAAALAAEADIKEACQSWDYVVV